MGEPVTFRRELGLVDATVVVAGAVIGVGIFANPSNVARIVGDPTLMIAAWGAGGLLALLGGFAYAELASRLPHVGGQYVYLARAYHPIVGFLYGIALLFIINGGGLAAVATIFASYVDSSFIALGPTGIRIVAATALLVLTAINVAGIRTGKRVNNALMALKLTGICALLGMAFFGVGTSVSHFDVALWRTPVTGWTRLLFTALVPIMFAYAGWQNCGFLAGEIRDPARNLARANILGVALVVTLYVGLNVAYLRVLTASQIAASPAVAYEIARTVAGERGGRLVATLIAVSSLGLLSVIVQAAPRLYYAMARDGLFPRRAAMLHPRFRTPAFMLWFQSGVSIALLATNTYDELLSYVVFTEWLFFALAAGALFVLRRRDPRPTGLVAMPGHPVTTLLFVLASAGIVVNTFFTYTTQSLIGSAILLAGAVSYIFIAVRHRRAFASSRRD